MSKATIVFDMPENCRECQFGGGYSNGRESIIMCPLARKSIIYEAANIRPEYCPLVEVQSNCHLRKVIFKKEEIEKIRECVELGEENHERDATIYFLEGLLNVAEKNSKQRLIDANKLIERLEDLTKWCKDKRLRGLEQAMSMIHEEPTAYSVDRIVEQFEKMQDEAGCSDFLIPICYAIEIVKAGGVDD